MKSSTRISGSLCCLSTKKTKEERKKEGKLQMEESMCTNRIRKTCKRHETCSMWFKLQLPTINDDGKRKSRKCP